MWPFRPVTDKYVTNTAMSRVSTSLRIFHSHIVRRADGTLDVSGLISTACYEEWLLAKFAHPNDAEAKKYHRILTNHVSGVDGRTPFDPEEEEAILTLLRKREPWPCFPSHLAWIGRRYRTKGFHEKQRLLAPPVSPVSSISPANAQKSLSISPRELPRSFKTSAAMQLQREVPQDNLEQLLGVLSIHDCKYVQDLTNTVVTNFSSPNFSPQDWHTVNAIFRYMIIAKTPKCRLQVDREKEVRIAKRLCEQFSHDDHTLVMVFDLAAKTYTERAIYQNDYSRGTIGTVLRNPNTKGVAGNELYSVVLAVSAAYFSRGNNVCVYAQRHWCVDNVTREFDMNYYVDPDSLLMVLWGKLTRPMFGLLAAPPAVTSPAPPVAAPEADLLPYDWENALPLQE
ncbi:hypothetical protein BASA81_005795 [Batrachochytrium salamandrivorans]|nr:hypothetical protein BASA81_005795 [Batrachochytrium salamandrivorans]